MELEFGFGTKTEKIELPEENLLEILLPNPVEYGGRGKKGPSFSYRLKKTWGNCKARRKNSHHHKRCNKAPSNL